MTLENLARIGRLLPHAPTREEIGKLLTGAARSLKDAGNTSNSNASRLTLAYTAIMESAQAALFANGYRPSKSEGGHHMTMIQSLVHTIGLEPARMHHSAHPSMMGSAPAGVLLDTPEEISTNAQRIYQQAVTLKAMPLGNVTHMTDDERQKIAAWFQGGAH